mmetsp:Transcript_4860/g.7190  ORF Transcript_4860/g.7190 Transcript_4860/m.7190 type:complete len:779 (+) Transcript_4860:31-2367(+)
MVQSNNYLIEEKRRNRRQTNRHEYENRDNHRGIAIPQQDGMNDDKEEEIPSNTFDVERPFMSYTFLDNASQQTLTRTRDQLHSNQPLHTLPIQVQELIVIEHLLYAMLGFEDKFIKCYRESNSKRVTFTFTETEKKDASQAAMVNRILPLCSNYVNIKQYCEEFSKYKYGTVAHAFCAALQHILQEYTIYVAKIEHQQHQHALTLQKIWFYIQPWMKRLDFLDTITHVAASRYAQNQYATGGALLRIIQEQAQQRSGDAEILKLCHFLLEKASVPYFEMLENWIYEGRINDDYHEFLVEENKQMNPVKGAITHENDEEEQTLSLEAIEAQTMYWQVQFQLQKHHVPHFLQKVAKKILLTGKYLNVIRTCSKKSSESNWMQRPDPIVYTTNERDYIEKIENAFSYANQQILTLIMKDYKFLDHLYSLKHYFFLNQGDVFLQMLEVMGDELVKPPSDIQLKRLNALLEDSIRTSSIKNNEHFNNVCCQLVKYKLIGFVMQSNPSANNKSNERAVTGFDALNMQYRLEYPLSLIIDRSSMASYEMLFRHVFYCKYIEHVLNDSWIHSKFLRSVPNLHQSFAQLFRIRMRMQQAVQSFIYYVTHVLEFHFGHFKSRILNEVRTVDDLIAFHREYLDTLRRTTLLTNNLELFQSIRALFSCIHDLANFVSEYMLSLNAEFEKMSDEFVEPLFINTETDKIQAAADEEDLLTSKRIKYANSHSKTLSSHLATFQQKFDYILANMISKLHAIQHAQLESMFIKELVSSFENILETSSSMRRRSFH